MLFYKLLQAFSSKKIISTGARGCFSSMMISKRLLDKEFQLFKFSQKLIFRPTLTDARVRLGESDHTLARRDVAAHDGRQDDCQTAQHDDVAHGETEPKDKQPGKKDKQRECEDKQPACEDKQRPEMERLRPEPDTRREEMDTQRPAAQ